ncbi:MAG: glycosyltransferase family 4 protein [Candidatus Jordarchaeum sp.]|uniref:glycosyltransferase family 4 protein n=1 Tax=Candidatus Jordarchaeum sp. TaxID=2823881 RepID=UPI004049EFBC
MIRIDWLTTGTSLRWRENSTLLGGRIYEHYVRNILRKKYNLNVFYLFRGNNNYLIIRFIEFLRFVFNCRSVRFSGDIVIRDFFSTIFVPFDKKRKNVIIIHHLEWPKKYRFFYKFLTYIFFKNAKRADKVVVVSKYWEKVLEKHGCVNTKIIYNSFDISDFYFDEAEILSFKKSLGVKNNKNIIYLGNARSEKGFFRAYRALKDLDAFFVATGQDIKDLPILCRNFSYRDYLRLLKVSSLAIFMSSFKEGWCRSAHEAMLCGTPVIGSGAGGMEELLNEGGQIICSDFSRLKSTVMDLLRDKEGLEKLSSRGRKFAEQFSLEYFERTWIHLIDHLAQR